MGDDEYDFLNNSPIGLGSLFGKSSTDSAKKYVDTIGNVYDKNGMLKEQSGFDKLTRSGDYTKAQLEDIYKGMTAAGVVKPAGSDSMFGDIGNMLGSLSGQDWMDVGRFGLGLASYFNEKKLADAQVDALRTNIAGAKASQDRINKTAESWANYSKG
jgi:hypothetical protein